MWIFLATLDDGLKDPKHFDPGTKNTFWVGAHVHTGVRGGEGGGGGGGRAGGVPPPPPPPPHLVGQVGIVPP